MNNVSYKSRHVKFVFYNTTLLKIIIEISNKIRKI